MQNQIRPLIMIIVALAAVAYIGGIVWAGVESLRSPAEPEIPDIVTQAITVIGAALATHFGAIFGISQFTGGNPRKIPSPLNVNAWAKLPLRVDEQEPPLSWLQIVAAYLYLLSLVAAVVFWALDGFSPNSAQVLINMAYTLVGVLGGVVAIVLNVKK